MNPLGYDGGYGSIPMAEFAERHNRDSFVAIMIETATAVAKSMQSPPSTVSTCSLSDRQT